ncbi:MAG: cytochrome-c oxidase, cbb3-type subunit II, partial [Verrucomicrobiaceae bacterium]
LVYTNFVETLNAIRPLMLLRVLGGVMYLFGFLLMGYNLWKTIRSGKPVNGTLEVVPLKPAPDKVMSWREVFFNDPLTYTGIGCLFMLAWIFLPPYANLVSLIFGAGLTWMAVQKFRSSGGQWSQWYEKLLENYLPFTVLTLVAVAIGGVIQIIPTIFASSAKNVEDRLEKIYTPLELAGRDLYVSEGCYNCHSQQIRTMVPDVLRYGDYSRLGESIYDHPFQWGSKRTGPDLSRVGGKYPNRWHFDHMNNPRDLNKDSNMPTYWWMAETDADIKSLPAKIAAQRSIGVPYPAMTKDEIEQRAIEQGVAIATDLKAAGAFAKPNSQIVALIAYLQKLGQFEKPAEDPGKTPWVNESFPIKPGVPDKFRVNQPLQP